MVSGVGRGPDLLHTPCAPLFSSNCSQPEGLRQLMRVWALDSSTEGLRLPVQSHGTQGLTAARQRVLRFCCPDFSPEAQATL